MPARGHDVEIRAISVYYPGIGINRINVPARGCGGPPVSKRILVTPKISRISVLTDPERQLVVTVIVYFGEAVRPLAVYGIVILESHVRPYHEDIISAYVAVAVFNLVDFSVIAVEKRITDNLHVLAADA